MQKQRHKIYVTDTFDGDYRPLQAAIHLCIQGEMPKLEASMHIQVEKEKRSIKMKSWPLIRETANPKIATESRANRRMSYYIGT